MQKTITKDNNFRVHYIKLRNGESLITYCSAMKMDGTFVLHKPYKFHYAVVNGTVQGTQLLPWIECNHDGPVVIVASEIITIINPTEADQKLYLDLLRKTEQAQKDREIEAQEEIRKDQVFEPKLVATNDNIIPSKSQAPIGIVSSDNDFEDDEHIIFTDTDS